MKPTISLTELTTKEGVAIKLPPSGVVALVGPNNAGKSATLREIVDLLATGSGNRVILDSISAAKSGTADDVTAWMIAKGRRWVEPSNGEIHFRASTGTNVHHTNIEPWWTGGPPFHDLASFLYFFAGSEARLGLSNSAPSFDALRELPHQPMQILYSDPELEAKLSDACRTAFGTGVVLNRFASQMIHLHYGEPPTIPATIPPDKEYLSQLNSIPLVSDQGDGVRCFVGLMLALTASDFPIVVVDEPEAFLHPPQARLLGRNLASMTPSGKQVFLATHSSDVVQGLLDAPEVPVTIVRIVREGDRNPISVLPHDQVEALWQDPLLRHSDIFEGLFHPTTVICEADADCRFYEASGEAITGRPTDIHFTHCGGKDRVPTAFRSLREVGVDARTIVDIDVLNRQSLIEDLVGIAGGEWRDFETDYRIVVSAVEQLSSNATVAFIKEKLQDALDDESGDFTTEHSKKIRELTKATGGWNQLKRSGTRGLPGGQATEAAERLLSGLKELGIYVVSVGELERWIPSVGGKGTRWLASVLEESQHQKPSDELVEFLAPMFPIAATHTDGGASPSAQPAIEA